MHRTKERKSSFALMEDRTNVGKFDHESNILVVLYFQKIRSSTLWVQVQGDFYKPVGIKKGTYIKRFLTSVCFKKNIVVLYFATKILLSVERFLWLLERHIQIMIPEVLCSAVVGCSPHRQPVFLSISSWSLLTASPHHRLDDHHPTNKKRPQPHLLEAPLPSLIE